ncbi:Thioesterase superfamily protein [Corynebacterium capitovis DSM 44611]|uniref:acyl-CoA thioesterase n=1 Tax=Corynebacterium capitovis TaxID=131081 RepID=UPI00037CDBAF|nr:acyl-CoA thioesterase [Corynebacterium capitovis]WKD57143.1 Thioesterase superfamily protein [Corynebacterium capitovis DSM 44611]
MTESENTAYVTDEVTLPVRWSDFDRYGHVNNATYIEYAQDARLAFGAKHFGAGLPVFVRHVEADYARPIMPDTTEVLVRTSVVRVGTTSFTTQQDILDRHGSVCCTVTSVLVAVDIETSTPREITSRELGILTQGPAEATE